MVSRQVVISFAKLYRKYSSLFHVINEPIHLMRLHRAGGPFDIICSLIYFAKYVFPSLLWGGLEAAAPLTLLKLRLKVHPSTLRRPLLMKNNQVHLSN